MATYIIKKEFQGKGSKTTFSKPVPKVGYHLELDKATPEQLEQVYLFCQPDFIEKVEVK